MPTKKWAFAHWCASTILKLRHNSIHYQIYAATLENTNPPDASRPVSEVESPGPPEPAKTGGEPTSRISSNSLRKCQK
jgi:hypothetical protein